MYTRLIILVLCAVTFALPLNINLGAFSPAVVVGDGEISFGKEGAKEAEGLVNSLAGASAGADNAAGAGAAKAAVKLRRSTRPVGKRGKIQTSKSGKVSITRQSPSKRSLESLSERDSEDRDLEERDLDGFKAALLFADGALTKGPSIDLGTGGEGSGVGITIRPPGSTKA